MNMGTNPYTDAQVLGVKGDIAKTREVFDYIWGMFENKFKLQTKKLTYQVRESLDPLARQVFPYHMHILW